MQPIWVLVWVLLLVGCSSKPPRKLTPIQPKSSSHTSSGRAKLNGTTLNLTATNLGPFLRLINSVRSKYPLVTAEDVALGHRWKTYVYDLPERYHAAVWTSSPRKRFQHNEFTCLRNPCPRRVQRGTDALVTGTDYCVELPVLMKLLLTLDFVSDPADAQLFLVPALLAMHHLATPHGTVISNDKTADAFYRSLRKQLPHYKGAHGPPHLFLSTLGSAQNHPSIRSYEFTINVGPRGIVIPLLNTEIELQPQNYVNAPYENRTYLLSAIFGYRQRGVRSLIGKQLAEYNGTAKIHGTYAATLMAAHQNISVAYSRVCVCPPGDLPFQKRFFDCLLYGSIPVVISRMYPEGESWWDHDMWPPVKTNSTPEEPINYVAANASYPERVYSLDEIVVKVPHLDLVSPGFNIVHYLEKVPVDVVQEKLAFIAEVRDEFVFDYFGTSNDAFTQLLHTLHRKLKSRGLVS